ncbi:isocitrate/isopropylmalate family dehydrogenase [Risungbinella massiliensis]|uniref:isocitrate/isopropylmalate family dehydrogenase n=1 Tax=Risungbinella massiliensis TaxID=1329796 RepID=UPI00389A3E76
MQPTIQQTMKIEVASMTEPISVVVMQGDQTGQELLEEALRVLEPNVIGLDLQFLNFDLSLENRRATNNQVVHEAAEAMKRTGYGIKAATITPENKGDVGSPNAILRKAIDGKVIVRTGRRIPGVRPVAGTFAPISVIRMAVGDAYGAKEWREGSGIDEIAYRTETIDRKTCRAVAEYTFRHARKMKAKVFGGPKFTVSPVYEGMLKEEMDEASKRYPDVRYEPQLIDATYALLLNNSGEALVIPALNRDGDCLSDMVLQLFGTIAGSESILMGFDEEFQPKVVMAEAPHGTAPSLYGKDIANPMAMILAAASVLTYIDDPKAVTASRAIYEATIETVREGTKTADIGGTAHTSEFTNEVISKVQTKLEVWNSLQGF